ncbi:MAG: hypothetical protein HY356_07805, partial [Gammaproteobacteria bacterium]|nr:hypothetical protein [Gammaproteobacteria bacterium]
MNECTTLKDPDLFFSLMRALAPKANVVQEWDKSGLARSLLVPSKETPAHNLLYLIFPRVTDGRGNLVKKWIQEYEERLYAAAEKHRITTCTVIFTDSWPNKHQTISQKGLTIRFVSSVHHIWVDRLGLYDESGNIDDVARLELLKRVGNEWSSENERSYTPPALSPVDENSDDAKSACTRLLGESPTIPNGRISIIYGPGGIGKTFFLKRVANKLTRAANLEPLIGIPIFADLPALLHVDALETWISRAGIRLPIAEIRALVRYGVIVPILDALDELVRGQAREGSRDFLTQFRGTTDRHGRGILSARDYYLNIDPLVRECLSSSNIDELSVGYFSQQGRRRYIQLRTSLQAGDAARWANRLEDQANDTLGSLPGTNVDALIGHPLFLDAFCAFIAQLPSGRRINDADSFRFTSPDIFGEIVQHVLTREDMKAKDAWKSKFGTQLAGNWLTPLTPVWQKKVLAHLVGLAARDGAVKVMRRESADSRLRQLHHGVYTFTSGVNARQGTSARQAFVLILKAVMGEPELNDEIPGDERKSLKESVLDDLAGAYLQHTLADTRPDLPSELVFATRHRAYFDYILAEQLLEKLKAVMSSPGVQSREEFINWCLAHHIFERLNEESSPPFASCLDFALWHREGLVQAAEMMDGLFANAKDFDEVLGSYVISIALALAVRANGQRILGLVQKRTFAPQEDLEISILDSIVPVISNLDLRECTFPKIRMEDIILRDSELDACEFTELAIRNGTWSNVKLSGCTIGNVLFAGTNHLENCVLDLEGPADQHISLDSESAISLKCCRLSRSLWAGLSRANEFRSKPVTFCDCEEIVVEQPQDWGPGRHFVNTLMKLVRKHGHGDFDA